MARTKRRRKNPTDEAILRQLTVEVDDYPEETRGRKGNYKLVEAWRDGVPVARFLFKLLRKYAEAKDVIVEPKLRRRGVASWLYRWVENRYGVKVLHSKDQTSDGEAFARGRRNPDDAKLLAKLVVTAEWKTQKKSSGYQDYLLVEAKVGKKIVGYADFAIPRFFVDAPFKNSTKRRLVSTDTFVVSGYRRRGVASAMYQKVSSMGFQVVPSPTRSHEGTRMWEGGRWEGRAANLSRAYPERYPFPDDSR